MSNIFNYDLVFNDGYQIHVLIDRLIRFESGACALQTTFEKYIAMA